MADPISAALLARIRLVTNKRARFVLDQIVAKGQVTNEEINQAGYNHPPRAARDVRELGIALKTIRVKHSDGRSIAAYTFDVEISGVGKTGRGILPKKERDALIRAASGRCQICGSTGNLQVDHRIPYEVAGESQGNEVGAFQILDGVCNRKKSWTCEHCRNWRDQKNLETCRSCYWANPDSYSHVAMLQERRADVVWLGDDVREFEALRDAAKNESRSVPDQIKIIIKNAKIS